MVSPGYKERNIISRFLILLTLAYIASSLSGTPATPRCPQHQLRADKATYGWQLKKKKKKACLLAFAKAFGVDCEAPGEKMIYQLEVCLVLLAGPIARFVHSLIN